MHFRYEIYLSRAPSPKYPSLEFDLNSPYLLGRNLGYVRGGALTLENGGYSRNEFWTLEHTYIVRARGCKLRHQVGRRSTCPS